MGWDDPNTGEKRALRQISKRAENPAKDLSKNLININQSIRYMSTMMTVMQNGIDDANKDILEQAEDFIKDLIIIFGLGEDGDTLNFEWGDLGIILQNFGNIFRLDLIGIGSDIPEWIELLWNNLFKKFIDFVFGGGPLVNLGQLTANPVNLIPSGSFDVGSTVKVASGWTWDSTVGRTSPGSAKLEADGDGGTLYPPAPGEVEEGKKYTGRVYVKWEGLTGSGAVVTPVVKWSSNTDTLITESALPTLNSPGASGGWTKLEALNLTAPEGARWARIVFAVSEGVEGTIWFDDAGLWAKESVIPQFFVDMLPEELQALLGWIELFVDSLLAVFGLSPEGELYDKIMDLYDEFDLWFGGFNDIVATVTNLVEQFVLAPLSHLLAWLTNTDPEDWDTLEEIQENILPAIMRLPIKILVTLVGDLFGPIPWADELVELRLANYLGLTANTARSAMIMANAATVTNIGNETGTAPTTITVQGSGEPLGASWFVYGNAKTLNDQIGIPITSGGTYVSEVVYTASQLTSDDMLAYMVLGQGGSTTLDSGLYVRCNADATRFIYANVFQNKVYLGHGSRTGGSRTYNDWLSLDVNWKQGDSLGLRAEGDLITLYQNSTKLIAHPDESHTAAKGNAYRYVGGRVERSSSWPVVGTDEISFQIAALAFVALGVDEGDPESDNLKQIMRKDGPQTLTSDAIYWYPTAGTYTLTVPPSEGFLDIGACGGGGGGGAGNRPWYPGESGGAATWQKATWDLTGMSGQDITIIVGAAGAGGVGANNDGVVGGTSSVATSGKTTVSSTGGAPGGQDVFAVSGNGGNVSANSIGGVTLPAATGGTKAGGPGNIGANGASPGSGGGGGAGGGTGESRGGNGGAGRVMCQLRAGATPNFDFTQILDWVSDATYPADIVSNALNTDVVGSGDDLFNIMVRARLSISSSASPTVEVRVNGDPVGSTTYDATGSNQDRTVIAYDVELADGDDITVWAKGINGTVAQLNTDVTITPTT